MFSVWPLRLNPCLPSQLMKTMEFRMSKAESASSVTLPSPPQEYFVCILLLVSAPPASTTG